MARINVNLPDEAYQRMKSTAEKSHMDMSEFVRQSLRVMTTLQEEKQQGYKVYIGRNDRAEKELVFP